jgi:ABC-2 type transport system permease protein
VKELAIAGATLRRTLRERSSIFFLFLFPMLMILVLGVAFGGSFTPRVGVVVPQSSPLAQRLEGGLREADGIVVVSFGDQDGLIAAVERGDLEAGVILPTEAGPPVRYVVRPGLAGQQVGSIVSAVIDRENARLRAAAFVAAETGAWPDEAQARVDAAAAGLVPMPVTVTSTALTTGEGRFDTMAAGELVLFVFLVAMTSSVALIESRRLGVSRRMLASPTSTSRIIRGEALARLSVSLLQAAVIMIGSALFFQVSWGDPIAAALLVTAFAAVASAVGLLVGALARTGEMAIGLGLLLALSMAALGGAMMPLELFSPAMRTAAHLTPHAWALDGFSILIRHGGATADILVQLGILCGGSVALFGVAAWLLRRRLVH